MFDIPTSAKASAMLPYKLIKSLKPIELFEIITKGTCDNHLEEIKRQIISIRGEWYLNNWDRDMQLDVLDLYLSDTGFSLLTTKEEAKRLEEEFKSWNVFYDVKSKRSWLNYFNYKVGFNYGQEAFMSLYKEWLRNKNLEILIEQTT
jgi:hypothetical protein